MFRKQNESYCGRYVVALKLQNAEKQRKKRARETLSHRVLSRLGEAGKKKKKIKQDDKIKKIATKISKSRTEAHELISKMERKKNS